MLATKLPGTNGAGMAITVTNTATSLLSLIRTASGDSTFSFSGEGVVKLHLPKGGTSNVRFFRDGNIPSTTLGEILDIGQVQTLYNSPAERFKLITESGIETVYVTIGTWDSSTPNDTVTDGAVTLEGDISLNSVAVPPYTHSSARGDWIATYTSSTTITLSGGATVSDNQLVFIKATTTGGVATYYINGVDGVSMTISGQVLTITGAGTPFASGGVYDVGVNMQDKAYDSGLDGVKNFPQGNAPVMAYSEDYDTTTPTSTAFVEGGVLCTISDVAILYQYSKTASTADDTYLKVVYLDTASGTVDYQETYLQNPSGGETQIFSNLYLIDKAVAVNGIRIPTNGAKYMRIDVAKKTDTGTDATLTTKITHIPRS